MTRSRSTCFILVTASALGFGSFSLIVPGWAEVGDRASLNFVSRLNAAIKSAVAASGEPAAAALRFCEDISASTLDLDAMMISASAGRYERLNVPHREAYKTAFRRRVIRDCATNAVTYMAGKVELAGVRTLASGEQIVGTRGQGEAEKIIMWQVRAKEPGRLVVTDVLVEGRSAMLSLREKANLAQEREPGDVDALIGSLER